ncbi:hypothetical protein CNMCM5793_002513 [Aspergillus hiratsukae]|uniref:Amino acid transporter transmembrane domain-containing protein n=1 Tax=Aspergillus hiratsukae TaxID=1194566 RepID=A0A8H6UVL4_9EURO|nr:hypothetical protein CNMCM5793_002513 [Aspergillus hiratsukae]KAF7165839.1 hypothetical protein CNMCM6106_001884 [Aspergillus hiratsukae]
MQPAVPLNQGETYKAQPETPHGEPFGNEEGAESKYRTLEWWRCAIVMLAGGTSLGILSLPPAVATLGIVPGAILIVGLGILTVYTGYVIGQFKQRYPYVHSMADAGEVLFGWIGPFASVVAAVLATMIAVGVQRLRNAEVEVTVSNSLYRAFLAVTDIVFAYAAHPAFFGFISEMKNPREWPKTLCFVQIINTTLYTVTGVVIYWFAGQHVASPALGSSGPLMAKVAYGIAIPTIVIAGVINGHIACKYIYVRLFRGTEHMHRRSFFSTGTWVAISVVLWTTAWVIAEAVPEFNNLLSLVTSLFSSWFSYGLCGVFWLFINRGLWFSSPRKIFLTIANFTLLGMGGCLPSNQRRVSWWQFLLR